MSAQVAATVIGTAAHRARIVEQQRHHRVAEVHVLLALEGQRLLRIDDDAHEAAGVEHALFEVELPRAVLLRHQLALQAVGEARDDGGEVAELLVEIGAQALQLLGLAQFLGGDDLVELAGIGLVVGPAMFERSVLGRAAALGGLVGLAHFGIFRHFTGGRVVGVHLAFVGLVG